MSREEAAQRILTMKPNDVRNLRDEDTALLLADLRTIGAQVPAWVTTTAAYTRKHLSTARTWASILAIASMDAPLPAARPKPAREPSIPTRAQRVASVASTAKCGISAAEVNAFLASLPQTPFHGEHQ